MTDRQNPLPRTDKNGSILYVIGLTYHRTDGPAFENKNGYKAWYIDGKPHREDGPAIEPGNEEPPFNKQEWWYYGEEIPVSNLKEFQSYIRNKAFW
jgi:hypothetical protein